MEVNINYLSITDGDKETKIYKGTLDEKGNLKKISFILEDESVYSCVLLPNNRIKIDSKGNRNYSIILDEGKFSSCTFSLNDFQTKLDIYTKKITIINNINTLSIKLKFLINNKNSNINRIIHIKCF